MKNQKDFTAYLDDIKDLIEKGLSFIIDMTFEQF